MNDLLEGLGRMGVIPVVTIENVDAVVEVGQALSEGGLACAEITFRTAGAEEAIRRLTHGLPEMLVGAGTVLNVEQARRAVAAGAQFVVSPGFDPRVVDWCLANDVPTTPGVCTPTEINMALQRGLGILKFFPASTLGGPSGLAAIAAAYVGVKFIPTGGVSAENLADYLQMPSVHACGGSWMAKKHLISAGDFGTISRLAREARAIVEKTRR